MSITISSPDYLERVYAAVLGKMIGVYLGRPFEGWSYKKIVEQLGYISYYVHEKRGHPLVISDDDLSGTFTFIRAIEDHDYPKDLTAAQIGETWLNYIIENRTMLWWGGLGTSSEHTAYLRLKSGIDAPDSGSIKTNGRVIAEQIGAQIFIDGWGIINPGNPARAAAMARLAGSVSHDGEAIYGAQIVAAMEAAAFGEQDIERLLDIGLQFIPAESQIAKVIAHLREFRRTHPAWEDGMSLIREKYDYANYGGNCPMVTNHAVIILALLWGDGDFQKSLLIANTAGWDTDCNSGNVGCLLGIRNGLAGIEAGPDWRGPVADQLLIPTADGGRSISDAVTEAYYITNVARIGEGLPALVPKKGARYHFELPGSVQGFVLEKSQPCEGTAQIFNVQGHSQSGAHSLCVQYHHLASERFARLVRATFPTVEQFKRGGYEIAASPQIYPGQTVRAQLEADAANGQAVSVRVFIRHYNEADQLTTIYAPAQDFAPGHSQQLEFLVPSTNGQPIAEIGLEITGSHGAAGRIYLDYLTWTGDPACEFKNLWGHGTTWTKAWYGNADIQAARIARNEGRGLAIQGTREWKNYSMSTNLTATIADAMGVLIRSQGMVRYYALILDRQNILKLIKVCHRQETVLAQQPFTWALEEKIPFRLEAVGNRIRGQVGNSAWLEAVDNDHPFLGGAMGILCDTGRIDFGTVEIRPLVG